MARENWRVAGYDRDEAARLFRGGLNPLVAVLLSSRHLTGEADIAALRNRDISGLSDPFLMRDMEPAAARVRQAIRAGEHVAVYGDYDVDGITSSCVLADYLRKKGLRCEIYIPERLEEGYGVKDSALDTIAAMGVDLVITVDCGITAAENKRHAAALGMDMVITDHHEVSGEMPSPPVVDPRRPDCISPAKELAGVGVAFKLICAVEGVEHTRELVERYGDLVAIGTIADVMPVLGENRILISRGLELVRQGRRPGITELMRAAGLHENKLSVMSVGFTIAPRINAAGRLGGTDTAVRLLLTEDSAEASELAHALCDLNRERQRIESEMLADALKMLKKTPPEGKPIVLASEGWHQGVAGIVASRVAERFSLPTIMICVKDGVGRGSCRSACGYNIFEALDACRGLLLSFGGHELAAGLTVEADKIGALREALGEVYRTCPAKCREPEIAIDFEVVKPNLLTVENIDALTFLEPYGTGNPSPILCMRGVRVDSVVPLSDGRHTKLWLSKGNTGFEAVYFGKSIRELRAEAGVYADVAFSPQVNEFRGRRTVQLNLCDFCV